MYLRNDFLEVLQNGKRNGVVNNIYDDFLSRLEEIDASIRQFPTKSIETWRYHDWVGFFLKLYPTFKDKAADWRVVPNPAGGFVGFWWYFKQIGETGNNLYIQLEKKELKFRIGFKDGSDVVTKKEVRDFVSQHLSVVMKRKGMSATLRRNKIEEKTDTVGVAKMDYLEFSNASLNEEATIKNLQGAESIVDDTLLEMSQLKG